MNPLDRVRRATPAYRLLALLIAVLATGLGTGISAAQGHPHARTGWLVGLGIGGGSGAIKVGNSTSDRQGGAAASFRAGYGFNDRISLELNSNLWTKEEGGVRLTFSASTAAVNFYPGSSGLVMKGGIGVGSAEASLSGGSARESGLGLNGGAAYEFRLRRTFAIGPQVYFGWTSLDSFDANWINFGLGATWYFVPE